MIKDPKVNRRKGLRQGKRQKAKDNGQWAMGNGQLKLGIQIINNKN